MCTMSIKTIKPVLPYYMTNGNKVVRTFKEGFVDKKGNRAILTKVVFETYKKGKLQSTNEAVAQVKWLEKDKPLTFEDRKLIMQYALMQHYETENKPAYFDLRGNKVDTVSSNIPDYTPLTNEAIAAAKHIDDMVEDMKKLAGSEPSLYQKIAMKNEFRFDQQALSDKSKYYFTTRGTFGKISDFDPMFSMYNVDRSNHLFDEETLKKYVITSPEEITEYEKRLGQYLANAMGMEGKYFSKEIVEEFYKTMASTATSLKAKAPTTPPLFVIDSLSACADGIYPDRNGRIYHPKAVSKALKDFNKRVEESLELKDLPEKSRLATTIHSITDTGGDKVLVEAINTLFKSVGDVSTTITTRTRGSLHHEDFALLDQMIYVSPRKTGKTTTVKLLKRRGGFGIDTHKFIYDVAKGTLLKNDLVIAAHKSQGTTFEEVEINTCTGKDKDGAQ